MPVLGDARLSEAFTVRENTMRGNNFVALNARKTECGKGHKLVGENVVVKRTRAGGSYRLCRTCRNADALARYHARRAAAAS